MKSKNISINLRENCTIPHKETYLIFYKSKKRVKIEQKFVDQTKNQKIVLNLRECTRIINLLIENVYEGSFKPIHGKMEIILEED